MIGAPLAGLKMLFVDINSVCARPGLRSTGQVDRHLVAVEVGVEALADQRVQLDRVALDERRLEGLDAHPVQRRARFSMHRVVADHLFEDVPDLLVLPFEHLLGALDRVGVRNSLSRRMMNGW